ncbi:MAG: hypothetical protein Q9P44_04420 [Anaerolineae bacterium]|nr:hypothetical protein [Anaerolineae bacterium]
MIAQQLLDTGILQFGIFVSNGKRYPYRLRLEMIPAYPPLFASIIDAVIHNLPNKPFDRLIGYTDCVAIASAVAQKEGVSLVYNRSGSGQPVDDLVGAYDIGHPACLLLNSITTDVPKFISGCQQVGLNIHTILALMTSQQSIGDIPILSVFSLENIIGELHETGQIPTHQMQATLSHIASEKQIGF